MVPKMKSSSIDKSYVRVSYFMLHTCM